VNLPLKARKHPSKLPITSSIRQAERVEEWRRRIWQTEHKYFMLLSPQHRELVRKIVYSCEKMDLYAMIYRLLLGLFVAWIATGTAKKMQDFIEAVTNGEIFIMNDKRFLPENMPADLGAFERLKSILVYDPNRHGGGIDENQACNATFFFDFLGPAPGPKPWVEDWASEVKEVNKQATAELGQEVVNEIWALLHSTINCDPHGLKTRKKPRKSEEKIAYW
jgi:hypothetical protein